MLRIRSLAPHRKYDPVYRVVAAWSLAEGGEKVVEKTVPFTRFFAEDGVFVHAEFETWLCQELPVIGGPPPAAANEQPMFLAPLPQKPIVNDATIEDDDIVMVGGEDGPGAAIAQASSSAKKRSKRKT